ncbi:MAG TPA: Nif3-like dinuclear metal center hexameric protein [Candidatus Hydrogenedentes bacterium]|nr:Nif3-like dinuclear metal center hexameric protein [Candidatus Hydrogenedentota bacterium]HPG67963.1 Nif3-like dinuclear metal center hexameric protein [Candidatus Hydrogenedentota bacterium]
MATTLDIREYLLENSPWVNPNATVDTIKIGDPARVVRRAGVCWYASIETIRAAHAAGCDLLICHEPTFWQHSAPEDRYRTTEPGRTKQRFLEETGMVVLRIHDTWDQWPGIGIRDSWAKWLALEKRIYASTDTNYHAIYEIEPQRLVQFAAHVALLVQPLGEDSVRVMGDPNRLVSHPAIGVGCAGPDADMVEAGADVLIVCYDGAPYWAVRERLHEMGASLIVVEHGTSEIPGIRNLCEHLWTQFPDVRFLYFGEHPKPWTVSAGAPTIENLM